MRESVGSSAVFSGCFCGSEFSAAGLGASDCAGPRFPLPPWEEDLDAPPEEPLLAPEGRDEERAPGRDAEEEALEAPTLEAGDLE